MELAATIVSKITSELAILPLALRPLRISVVSVPEGVYSARNKDQKLVGHFFEDRMFL